VTANSKVIVVDDDADLRNSLRCLFQTVGLNVEVFGTAEAFLESDQTKQPGCLLLDVRMPGMGGLQLLEYLQTVNGHLPVVVFTGHGDVPMVLQAMKSGAFAFLEKPATHQEILDCVQKALAFDQDRRRRDLERTNVEKLLAQLSPRELEVMDRLVAGMPNKKIAMDLAISERTLEKHRKNIMLKMELGSLAELIKLIVLYKEHIAPPESQ